MRIVVVYESMFGNTRTIALAIAGGLAASGAHQVTAGSIDEIAPAQAATAELIVVGGPTHNRGLAKETAHATLARKPGRWGAPLPGRTSLRAWLAELPAGRAAAAAFDTRYNYPRWIVGAASREIARALGDKGYAVAAADSFFVGSVGGPLADGEQDRALAWGEALPALVPVIQAA